MVFAVSAGNNAAGGGIGGATGDTGASIVASNSIIAANVGTGGTDNSGFAATSIDNGDVCTFGAPPAGAGNICANPLLVSAAAGDVHETPSSPTIDKGLSTEVRAGLTTDAYGAPRITDGLGSGQAIVDMGAAESPAVMPPAPSSPPAVPAPPGASAPHGGCTVPKLTGLTLAAAQRALTAAGCTLGKVTSRRPGARRRHLHRPRAKLLVASQSAAPGTTLSAGAAVSVTLAPAPGQYPKDDQICSSSRVCSSVATGRPRCSASSTAFLTSAAFDGALTPRAM